MPRLNEDLSPQGWRSDLRSRIQRDIAKQGLPPDQAEAEIERRFRAILNLEVPSMEELRAMQKRGELPSDEELAREIP